MRVPLPRKYRLAYLPLLCLGGVSLTPATAQQPKLRSSLAIMESVYAVALTRDGRFLASGGDAGPVQLRDLANGKRKTLVADRDCGNVSSMAFSDDGKLLATGHAEMVVLWDTAKGTAKAKFKRSLGYHWVTLSGDGKFLAAAGLAELEVEIWDLARNNKHTRVPVRSWGALALNSDGSLLATGLFSLTLWDMRAGEGTELLGFGEISGATVFSSDGKLLVSGHDKKIRLWDLSKRKEVKIFSGHTDVITALAMSSDAKLLASGSQDKTVKLWNVSTGKEIATIPGQQRHFVSPVALSGDGRLMATGHDGTLKLWDIPATGRAIK